MTMTQSSALDQSVDVLQAHKETWARLPIAQKVGYLADIRQKTFDAAERWVKAATQAKGIAMDAPIAGEEWLSGPWATLYGINRLIRSLEEIARAGVPQLPKGAVRTRADGQVVVNVFPVSLYDRLLLNGIRAEVWMQPGVTADTLADTMAVFYKERQPQGKVSLVLGAGNIASIAPLDVLYKMFVEGDVCILKMNPVNEYLGAFMEEIFAPLIAADFVRVVYGGADVGAALCTHPGVEAIHITGSDRTYEAIVFGTGAEGAANKRANRPVNTRPVSAELGNVSPTIVVPGPWTAADIAFQAAHVLTQKMHNAGHNCNAAQVLIMPQTWAKTPAFLDAVRGAFRATQPRTEYYPGIADRQQAFVAAHSDAETFDNRAVPRTLIAGVASDAGDDICFRTEAFGDILSTTTLPGATAAEFLRNAVAFCNATLWGTLGANIIIHPATIKELGPALEEAIADLRYGCIGVNAWTGVGFLTAETTWGAFPGHTPDDIQSGVGVVHNSYMFDKPQKSVVYQPFAPAPRTVTQGVFHLLPMPPWFVTNKQAQHTARRLVAFEAKPGFAQLPGIFFDALRG